MVLEPVEKKFVTPLTRLFFNWGKVVSQTILKFKIAIGVQYFHTSHYVARGYTVPLIASGTIDSAMVGMPIPIFGGARPMPP